jgi:hypothetical protein
MVNMNRPWFFLLQDPVNLCLGRGEIQLKVIGFPRISLDAVDMKAFETLHKTTSPGMKGIGARHNHNLFSQLAKPFG